MVLVHLILQLMDQTDMASPALAELHVLSSTLSQLSSLDVRMQTKVQLDILLMEMMRQHEGILMN